MIDGNTLKFGYGDIATSGSSIDRIIRFQQFIPPAECGENLLAREDEIEYVSEMILFELRNHVDYREFYRLFQELTVVKDMEDKILIFKGYRFDFTNYNPKSVQIVSDAVQCTMDGYAKLLAC